MDILDYLKQKSKQIEKEHAALKDWSIKDHNNKVHGEEHLIITNERGERKLITQTQWKALKDVSY